ncbi:MAG: hypothetical protein D6788_10335, partial [Planctomycetota bacterium]
MSPRVERIMLSAILLLYAAVACTGITWGLPARRIDPYLFSGPPWPGEVIFTRAGAGAKLTPQTRSRLGADVDLDPLRTPDHQPVLLTEHEEDLARIYLRYRLYTYQPDEMITMMALAGMDPRRLQFDPRLYQYGGLFLYPVGGLIAATSLTGWIDLRSDVTFYLDAPEAFGRFYVVARAYTAAWGALGVLLVFGVARRLGGSRAGLLAALLFALMPVVVCMAHEGKPHLPGAVLMLAAVYFALRHLACCSCSEPRASARATSRNAVRLQQEKDQPTGSDHPSKRIDRSEESPHRLEPS